MTGRVVADFVAGLVNRAAAEAEGASPAAWHAAEAVRGPGAEELRAAVGRGGGDLAERIDELAQRWGSPALASAAVAIRTGGVGRVGGYLLERAGAEAGQPSSFQRAAAEFVVGYLDALATGAGPQMALENASRPLRGPGADELVEAANVYGITLEDSAERLAEVAQQWESPVLASLATALRAGGPGPARRAYWLAGAQAVASGFQPGVISTAYAAADR